MSDPMDNTDWGLGGIGKMCRQAVAQDAGEAVTQVFPAFPPWGESMPDDKPAKEPIRLTADKEIPELLKYTPGCDFRTTIGKEWGEEFERKLFTYMLVMVVEEVYVYTEIRQDGLKWTCKWYFSMGRPEGKQCMQYNMHNLVAMTDEEFDRIKKNTNYGLVKSWREIMRGKYDSK